MQNSQFEEGASRASKLLHWSMLGGAPKEEGAITRMFCKNVGNPALNAALIFAVVSGTAVNIVTEKVAGKTVFDLDLH